MVEHAGGKLLGKGSFGCVFNPPFVGKSGITYINRIMFDTHAEAGNLVGKLLTIANGKNELKEYMHLRKRLDPDMSFSIQPLGFVTLTRKDIEAHDEPGKRACDHLEFHKPMIQIYYADGGPDLRRYMSGTDPEGGALFVDKILTASLPIWKGIRRMQIHGSAHTDITGANVVYDNKRNIMRLIDFGLLQTSRMKLIGVFQEAHILAWLYDTWPIELQIMSYITYGRQFGAGYMTEEEAITHTVDLYTNSLLIPNRSSKDVAKRHIVALFDAPNDFITRFWDNLPRIDECSFALVIGMLLKRVINKAKEGIPMANISERHRACVDKAIGTITKMCNITYFMSPDSLLNTLIEEISLLQQPLRTRVAKSALSYVSKC